MRIQQFDGWPIRDAIRRQLRSPGMLVSMTAVLMAVHPVPSVAQAVPDCGNATATESFDIGSNALTCSGDNSPGISTLAENLYVTGLTANISPVAGHGIDVFGSLSFFMQVELGAFEIVTTAPGQHGINANRQQGVTIAHQGNISATGMGSIGIRGRASQGEVSISSRGDIAIGDEGAGIAANTTQGTIVIQSEGNITGGANSSGIHALIEQSGNGATIAITSEGNIILRNIDTSPSVIPAGIAAFGYNDVSIRSTGNISTNGEASYGIYAETQTGNVSVNTKGNITASGTNAAGIRAQSSLGSVSLTSAGKIDVGDAGSGLFANTAQGAITIRNDGDISGGAHSSGIQAIIDQSGNDAKISITSNGDIAQRNPLGNQIQESAGILAVGHTDISIISNGRINVLSDYASGITAKTLSGNISIATTGDISAHGLFGAAIYVEGADTNSLKILGGTVSSNNETTGAIVVNSNPGASNRIDNYGTIGSDSFFAIVTNGLGRTVVNNFGSITGDVELYSDVGIPTFGPSAFNNALGGDFNFTAVHLGQGGVLTNHGTLAPAGAGLVVSAILSGSLKQGASGKLGIDIDLATQAADRLDVLGEASLNGKIVPTVLGSRGSFLTREFKILSATGGVTNHGLAVSDTALIDYELLYPNRTDVVLSMLIDFDVPGLTANQLSVLDYFGRGFAAGMPDAFDSIYATLLNTTDTATVASIAEQLHSQYAGAAVGSALHSGEALAGAMRSCPVADGPNSELRETSCLWAKPTYRQFTQKKDTDRARISDDTSGISGGFQTALADNFWGGLAFSLEESNTNSDRTTAIDGTWWQLGGVVKWAAGPWKVSASLSGGSGDLETARSIAIPGLTAIASSNADTSFATGLIRLAYSFGGAGGYVTPMLNAGLSTIHRDGLTETGAGALNLEIASATDTFLSGGPAIEMGTTINAEGLTFRPYARFGATFLSDDTIDTAARFASAPEALDAFKTVTRIDDVYADISAGVQLFSASGVNLRFNYDARIGEASEQHGIDARLTVNY